MNEQSQTTQNGQPGQSDQSGGQTRQTRQAGRARQARAGHRKPEDMIAFMDEVDAALHRQPYIGARALSIGTAVVFVIFLVWAYLCEIDELTKSEGHVISSQRTQNIENLEGGILQELLVQEGQVVDTNTLLARVSNETAESAFRDAQMKINEQEGSIARLESELYGIELIFPPDLMEKAPQVVQDQRSMLETRNNQRAAEIKVLDAQLSQRVHEVDEQTNRKLQTESNIMLARQQLDIAEKLQARGLYSKVDLLTQQQKLGSLQGDLRVIEASIPKARAAEDEARQKLDLYKANARKEMAEEINKRRTELNSLRETLSAGGDRVDRTELHSPVRGVIKRILNTTVGGVIKPGETVMEIVPLDDSLLIEAKIRPADIAFIHSGQKATIKVTAYDFSIYGGLEGVVEQISADTIEDRRGEMFYLVKIRTPVNAISYHDRQLPIIPGMICSADILTGKRTVLDFLVKPILKVKQNALRER